MPKLRIALGQYDTGWHNAAASLATARGVVQRAVREGAQLVMLPEMCTTGFTMDQTQAEPLEGDSAHALSRMARENGVHILAGLSTREDTAGPACFYNLAVLFGKDGEIISSYRKQRLFAMGGEHESYLPGAESRVMEVHGVRVAPFVCYDLRFPELFRAVALDCDALLLIANWPARRRAHWDVLVRARAIENLAYMVAVNRTGDGDGVAYDGGSAAYDPWGELLVAATDERPVPVVEIDSDTVAATRDKFPFLRDLRVEAVR